VSVKILITLCLGRERHTLAVEVKNTIKKESGQKEKEEEIEKVSPKINSKERVIRGKKGSGGSGVYQEVIVMRRRTKTHVKKREKPKKPS